MTTQEVSVSVPLSKLNARQARTWLLNNDPEGSDIYLEKLSKKDLVDTVKDNLSSFGINEQSGSIIIKSSLEQYQDDLINAYNSRY
jgi:hypothetical protein